jgi:protein-tyrosine phosphatase
MAIDSTQLLRHVRLDALPDVREVGGYTGRAGQTVRWHRLYRSGELSRATRGDLDTLAGLGIRTVVDLRSDREAAARPAPTLPGAYVEHHHLPLLRDGWRPRTADAAAAGRSGDDLLVERYLQMLVEGSPAIADVLALLASPAAYPVLIHSTLGQDRTGVVIAVVLGLLAVHDEMIVEDYGWSGSPPEVMARFLERIRDRARSMVGFARSIGVPFESIEALHENLLS